MDDQIRIEPKGEKFSVVLKHGESLQEMDVRNTYRDAEDLAVYVARRAKLDVYYREQLIFGGKG